MKKVLKYFFTFVVTLLILVLSFSFSSSISKDSIKDNVNKSLDEINDKKQYDNYIKGIDATKYDLLADVIVLNILVSQDYKHPLESVMASKYYDKQLLNYKEDLREVNNNNVKIDDQYLRYWHGSIMIIKPLLLFFDLNNIIILNYVVLFFLLIIFLSLLFKKDRVLCLVTFISLLLVYSFYVPMTLEYSWNYYIMFIIGILSILYYKNDSFIYLLLFISGMVTCFFDFLTTETLTLILPLTIILLLRYKENIIKSFKDGFLFIIKCCLLWGISYVFMWFSKWIISSVILNINAFEYVFKEAIFRVNGKVSKSMLEQLVFALINNCSNIMAFSIFKKLKVLMFLCFSLFAGSFFFLFRKKKNELWFVKLLFIVAIVPCIRFLILSNHSYVHDWFTYRALIPSIVCFFYCFIYGIDFNILKKSK